MPFSDTNIFARDDTFFGICQAIGEDLGFNPNYLRIAFALPLLLIPIQIVSAYLALGLVVFLVRLLVPEPRARVSMSLDQDREVERVEQTARPVAAAA